MNNILIYLLNHKTEKFTINQISKVLNINYRIAHTQIKRLELKGLIKTETVGRSLLCSLTNKFDSEVFLAELTRRDSLSKNLNLIQKRFSSAKQNFILLLFGSYAKGNFTKHSDIDLLTITEKSSELEEIASLIPLKIHLTCISYDEFLREKNSKKLSVVSEAIQNNIILLGIEEYYRILNYDE